MLLNAELLILTGVVIVSLLGFVVWSRQKLSAMSAQLEAVMLIQKEADRQTEQLRQELNELRSGTIGVGRRVLDLEKGLKQLQAKLEESVELDPGAKLYTRAAKMVALGAGIEELVAECELPRAEAELLLRLHRKVV